GDMCVIYLYDPNHTATHQRVEYSIINQNKIKKLKANDFLTKSIRKVTAWYPTECLYL
ncbi:ShET2/EspL2 family type III secretion system effector toxin, partial [Salmonella enterica]|nr:ShET2/EspL2 family type III secretion system effector toxin [Salmonella enterica]